jgi:hypothetical protein
MYIRTKDADELSGKVWSDANKLIAQYGSQLDVVYDDPEFFWLCEKPL